MTLAPDSQSGKSKKPTTWVVLAIALSLPTLVTWIYFVLLKDAAASVQQLSYSIGKVIQFALPILWVAKVSRQRIAWNRTLPNPTIPIAFGLLAAGAMLAIYFLVLQGSQAFAEPAESVRQKVAGMGLDSTLRFAALGLFYSLCHSFLEEYYWRWFVFFELRKVCDLWPAVAISSLGFMAHHVLVLACYFGWDSPLTYFFSFSVAVGGAFWAVIYHRSRSLLGPWISHLIVDAAIFFVGYQIIRDTLT